MDKPLYLGFAVLELKKLHMYETFYDKLQPYSGQQKIQLHYIDTDAIVLSLNTKNIINDLKNLEDILEFSNVDEKQELFSNKKKLLVNFKIETPEYNWIDEFLVLKSKLYAFKCGNYSENKLKGIYKSQLKHIKFEEYKKILDGENYQNESYEYIFRSINKAMYLQALKKSTKSTFDGKRFYKNNIKSKPWN